MTFYGLEYDLIYKHLVKRMSNETPGLSFTITDIGELPITTKDPFLDKLVGWKIWYPSPSGYIQWHFNADYKFWTYSEIPDVCFDLLDYIKGYLNGVLRFRI